MRRKTYARCVRVCVSVRESGGVAVAWDTQAQGEKKKRERSDRDQMFGLSPRRAPAPKSAAGKIRTPRGTCGCGPVTFCNSGIRELSIREKLISELQFENLYPRSCTSSESFQESKLESFFAGPHYGRIPFYSAKTAPRR